MTRQRSRKSIESVVYQVCPYCQGKGATKSALTMAITAIRKIKRYFHLNRGVKKIEVLLHPVAASRFFNEDKDSINRLERYYRVNINIKSDPSLHIEQVKIIKIV